MSKPTIRYSQNGDVVSEPDAHEELARQEAREQARGRLLSDEAMLSYERVIDEDCCVKSEVCRGFLAALDEEPTGDCCTDLMVGEVLYRQEQRLRRGG